jgi:invasion protein IalB
MTVDRISALGRVLAAATVVALAGGVLVAPSHGQQPAPGKAQEKAKEHPKAQPKAPPPGGEQKSAAPGGEPQITYSAWTKVCQKGPDANAKRICFIGRDGRLESGMPVVAAVLIEPDGEPRKLLRVTLPLGMALQPGTRVIIDEGQPMTAPYMICVPGGCMADYEASGELIGKMKTGKLIHVQGINGSGQPVSLQLPLADFAKSYDGPPVDPKTVPNQTQPDQPPR